jgi:hypothetical protein
VHQSIDLLHSLFRWWVRYEVTLKRAQGQLSGLVDGSGWTVGVVADLFLQSIELFKKLEYSQWRVSGLYRQGCSVSVGFEFLIFAVASGEYFDRQTEEVAERSKIAKPSLGLDTLGAMPQVDVLDLVSEDGGEGIFTPHQRQQASADEDVTAWEGERIYEGDLRDVVKLVVQFPPGVKRDLFANLLEVCLNLSCSFAFGCSGLPSCLVGSGELVADLYFVFIRHAIEAVWNARQFMLPIGGCREDGLGAWACVDLAPFSGDDCKEPGENDDGEWDPALHRSLRMASR